ncbi:MAG: arylamine N-acetyltransferase [Gammaproteobacteria bacterium]|jgi:N-hydroxyarylamine O-acetyltransferase|nr:arylamine N-acetyltransferase [Gammaproteobacteria bacterium]
MKSTPAQRTEYFTKIGFVKQPEPTLEVLIEIAGGHAFTFPFETVSVHDSGLDHRPNHRTSFNFNHLHRKLVHFGRGGRCVELNFVLQTILKDIGFNVTPILSDDLYMSADLDKDQRPKHSAAIVTIDNKNYLVDSAFGGIGLLLPIALQGGVTQQYSEKFRIIQTTEYPFVLEVYRKDIWTSLYGFEHKAATLKSYRELNAKNANPLNKDSHFKTFFACTKPIRMGSQNGRITIADETLSIVKANKSVHKEIISTQEQLHRILKDQFNIDVKNRFLRFRKVDMLAYQESITHPPSNHHHQTRLKDRYDSIEKENYPKTGDKPKNLSTAPRLGRKFQI